jgi:CBS domain-containing protein
VDIAGFLRSYPPFDALGEDEVARLANQLEIEHFPSGTVILRKGGEPAPALFVIRKGAVELLDDGRVLDLLIEGEVFGQFSLLAHEAPTLTVRAHEDTLCYLIPAELADPVLQSGAGSSFVIGSMRRRISAAAEAAAEAPDRRLSTIGSLIRRPVVTARPADTVATAAARMADERVSSLLVTQGDQLGIVTDRDLRSRVVATRVNPDAPVADVATFPAMTLPAYTLAGDALLAMFAHDVHHFPVTGPGGDVMGVVSDTDLMGLGRHTPFATKSAISRASSPEEVAEAARELPDLVVAMVRARADPIDVGRVVALVIDALAERLLRLGIERLGDPPCAWAWLALGSAARHEQALHTDQDHALTFEPVAGAADPDPYFAELAEFVTAGLEASGVPRCKGDAMAVHPTLRRPLGELAAAFAEWMERADTQSTILSSIGYDFRRVAGPLDAEPVLDDAIREARQRPTFVRALSRRSLDLRPPTGFVRDLVVEAKGEHAGRLDVKHGGITIVSSLARTWAIAAGVTAKSTIQRLEGAAAAGAIEPTTAHELSEAFHFLWDVRVSHQASQVEAGEAPDDYVDPVTLGPFSRTGLKEAFRAIARGQRQLATEEGLSLR